MTAEAARWATFDCYGTLVDWEGGIAGAMARLWPGVDQKRLLRCYHAVEPVVQEGRPAGQPGEHLSYRKVLARVLRAVAAIEALPLRPADECALADSLPTWSAFPDV